MEIEKIEREILDYLKKYKKAGVLATTVLITRKFKGWPNTAIRILKGKGMITEKNGIYSITAKGLEAINKGKILKGTFADTKGFQAAKRNINNAIIDVEKFKSSGYLFREYDFLHKKDILLHRDIKKTQDKLLIKLKELKKRINLHN